MTPDPLTDPAGWLSNARRRLDAATAAGDVKAVQDIDAEASAARRRARHLGCASEASLAAGELRARAIRALALAVRKGQAAGQIRARGQSRGKIPGRAEGDPDLAPLGEHPGAYLAESYTRTDAYAMADGLTGQQFEEVLTACRAMENMSRAHIVRACRAKLSRPRKGNRLGGGVTSTRTSLPDFARQAAWNLRKSVERVQRITADDRLGVNKDQVAAQLRGHLEYAIQVLPDVLDRID